MTVVVTDTSPLVTFAFLKLEHLLPQMFGSLLVPPKVVEEAKRSRFGFAGIQLVKYPDLVIRRASDTQLISQFETQIDAGEAEALALAIEVKADLVLIDDAAARELAQSFGFTVTGTIGLLLRAKNAGIHQSNQASARSVAQGFAVFYR